MRRPEGHPTQTTLMEIYAVAPGDGSLPARALRDEIEAEMALALAGMLLGERHGEGFVPCV